MRICRSADVGPTELIGASSNSRSFVRLIRFIGDLLRYFMFHTSTRLDADKMSNGTSVLIGYLFMTILSRGALTATEREIVEERQLHY